MNIKTGLSIFFSLTLLFSGISFAASHSHDRASRTKASSTLKKESHHRTRARTRTKAKAIRDQVVNINRADAKLMSTLNGIGLQKAKKIVQYRDENGKFKSIDDLTKVRGISEKTIEKNHDRLKLK